MAIVIRNESQGDITLNYNDVDITLEPNKTLTVDSIDELMMDSMIIKIRKGVIKIKGIL